jgi:hypothetical protein
MNWTRAAAVYLKLLAVCYGIGFGLHVLDVLGLRHRFALLPPGWKAWILYLLVFDLIAAIGLWLGRTWGIATFVLIALSQLVAYLGFPAYFGKQTFLIAFHLVTLSGAALLLRCRDARR